MPLLSAGVLLWGPRRRRVRAAALCAGLLSSRRRRSAQLVHRTVPRVAITVHKQNEHEEDADWDERDDHDKTGNGYGDRDPETRWPPRDGIGGDGERGESGAPRVVLTSGDVSVLLGEASGPTPTERRVGEDVGKPWISTGETKPWMVQEGRPWILDGDGPWNMNGDVPWNIDGQGLFDGNGGGPWTSEEYRADSQMPDCLCSAECRSVWALTLDDPVKNNRDEDSTDSGAHLSPGPESPSSGDSQSCLKQAQKASDKHLANKMNSDPASPDGTPDDPLVAALTAQQLWRRSGNDGAAVQVSPATCDLLARIATVWQADLEERHHLDRLTGDSGQTESEPSSPEPASLDGEIRLGEIHRRSAICWT